MAVLPLGLHRRQQGRLPHLPGPHPGTNAPQVLGKKGARGITLSSLNKGKCFYKNALNAGKELHILVTP